MSAFKKRSSPEPVHFRDILILKSEPRQILRVETFLEKINKKLRLDETKYHRLLVATTEAVNNGMIHGNKRLPEKEVTLTCEVKRNVLVITIEDEGSGIDPKRLPDPLAKENLLRENGRGVFLMRTLMDEISFRKGKKRSAVIMAMKMK